VRKLTVGRKYGPRVRAVIALARRYGVDTVVHTSRDEVTEAHPQKHYSGGPSWGDMCWPGGPIVIGRVADLVVTASDDGELASDLIHELGHVLIGGDPNDHDEEHGPGLALDHDHHALIHPGGWNEFMSNFQVSAACRWGNTCQWGDLTADEQRERIRASRRVAILAGLVADNGELNIRPIGEGP